MFKWHSQEEKSLAAFDLHVHTSASPDAFPSPSRIIRKAKKANIGLAIADHNEIDGAIKAGKKAKNVIMIPGIEVKTQEGVHVLFYFEKPEKLEKFYQDIVQPRKSPRFFVDVEMVGLIKKARRYNCLTGFPHPYVTREGGCMKMVFKNQIKEEDLLSLADFIETKNTASPKKANKLAARLANKYKKPATAGSDAHLTRQIGTGLTLMQAESVRDVLQAIASGQTKAVGRELPWNKRNSIRLLKEARLIFRKGGLRTLKQQINQIK